MLRSGEFRPQAGALTRRAETTSNAGRHHMSTRSRIVELDGLRTIAITAVLLIHFSPHSDLFDMGWVGVNLFFVISGFLITGILLNRRSDPRPYQKFYWRRIIRIFPPYYAVLAVIAVLAFVNREGFDRTVWMQVLFFLPALRRGISFHLIFQRLMGHTGFDLSRQGFAHASSSQYSNGLGVFWSLAVEELFYLLWAPVVLKGSQRLIIVFAVAPVLLCPILRGLTHTVDWYEGFGFITNFDSLAVGGCVALLLRAKPNVSKWTLLAPMPPLLFCFGWLCLCCGLFSGIEVRSTELFSIFGYSLLALIFGCVVAACVRSEGSSLFAPLRWGPVLYIGTISYTMYLVHSVIYVAVAKVLAGDIIRGLLAAFLTIGAAALSWRYFETPILRLRNWPECSKPPTSL
jgi:peptidoglycan/LPS O-acetylase OafA/YrhL